jgi:hypothetical protein
MTATPRPLYQIAGDIIRDYNRQGKNIPIYALPYVSALNNLDDINDMYGADSARSIVLYTLSNLSTWRGETARSVKAELKKIAGIK